MSIKFMGLFLLRFLLSLLFFVNTLLGYKELDEIVQVNGQSLKNSAFAGDRFSVVNQFSARIEKPTLGDHLISQVDQLYLKDQNHSLTGRLIIVAGHGGKGGAGGAASGGGGGGATFGSTVGSHALGGKGRNSTLAPNTDYHDRIGVGGRGNIMGGACGGQGGNGAGGGGGAAFVPDSTIKPIGQSGGGQGGGIYLGGGGGGASTSGNSAYCVATGGGQGDFSTEGNLGYAGTTMPDTGKYITVGGSGMGVPDGENVHFASGGGSSCGIVGDKSLAVTAHFGKGGVVQAAVEKIALGGQGGSGSGKIYPEAWNKMTSTAGGFGGGGGGAGGIIAVEGGLDGAPGASGQSTVSVSNRTVSGGSGGRVLDDIALDTQNTGNDLGIMSGGGGAGLGKDTLAAAGGGAGGSFGVAGGGGGLAYAGTAFSFGGGGGGGFGATGGSGWQNHYYGGSGNGGDGGTVRLPNTLVPESILTTYDQTACNGISGGNGGNGFQGGNGGNGGGTFFIKSDQSFTVESNAELWLYSGVGGENGSVIQSDGIAGLGGIGGGVINIAGTMVIADGAKLKLIAPSTQSVNSGLNGGLLSVATSGNLTVDGGLFFYGLPRLDIAGDVSFSDTSYVLIDQTNFSIFHSLFEKSAPYHFISEQPVNDDENGVGAFKFKKWTIRSKELSPDQGQSASALVSLSQDLEVYVDADAALFVSTEKPLTLNANQTLVLSDNSSFYVNGPCVIKGVIEYFPSARIVDTEKKLKIFGKLIYHEDYIENAGLYYLNDGSVFESKLSLDVLGELKNKDITWNIGGAQNYATALPARVNIPVNTMLTYTGAEDQHVYLSGSGVFQHLGSGVLTIAGSSPHLEINGPVHLEDHYGQNDPVSVKILEGGHLTVGEGGSLNASDLEFHIHVNEDQSLQLGKIVINGKANLPTNVTIKTLGDGLLSEVSKFQAQHVIENTDNITLDNNATSYSATVNADHVVFNEDDSSIYGFTLSHNDNKLSLGLEKTTLDVVSNLVLGPTESFQGDFETRFYVLQNQRKPTHVFTTNTDDSFTSFRLDKHGNIFDNNGFKIDDLYSVSDAVTITKSRRHYPFGLDLLTDANLRITQGAHILGDTIKVNGGALSLEAGNSEGQSVQISNPIQAITGSVNLSGWISFDSTVNISRDINLSIAPNTTLNFKPEGMFNVFGQRYFSNFTVNGGAIKLKDEKFIVDTVKFSNVQQNNSILIVQNNNNFQSHTMGERSTDYNAVFIDPDSRLSIDNTMTFFGKNALVIKYKASQLQDLRSSIISYDAKRAGDAGGVDRFDHVFTLLMNNENTSSGLLFPADATVQLNDTIYGFRVTQDDTAVNLEIEQGVPASAGSNLDDFTDAFLNGNLFFQKFVNYQRDAASYQSRLEALPPPDEEGPVLGGGFEGSAPVSGEVTADDIIANASSIGPELGGTTLRTTMNAIYLTSDQTTTRTVVNFSPSENAENRIQKILKNMESLWPIVKMNEHVKVWLSPFVRSAKAKGQLGNNVSISGALFGGEYFFSTHPLSIGFIGGYSLLEDNIKNAERRQTFENSVHAGLYGSYALSESLKVYALYIKSIGQCKEFSSSVANPDQYKKNDDLWDIQLSQLHNILATKFSLSFNMGHSRMHSRSGYNDAYIQLLQNGHGRIFGTNQSELYGGIGMNWLDKEIFNQFSINTRYDFGLTYQKNAEILVKENTNNKYLKKSRKKMHTHYLTLTSSINMGDFFKTTFGYSVSFSEIMTEKGFYLKAAYQF